MMNPVSGEAMIGHNHGSMSASEMETMENDQKNKVSFEVNAKFKEQMTKLLRDYHKMSEALVESDPDKTAEAAKKFSSSPGNVDMSLLEGDAHMMWMDKLEIKAKQVS